MIHPRCAFRTRGGSPRLAVLAATLMYAAAATAAPAAPEPAKKPLTTTEVLAASGPADWRPLDPQHTVYLELASGRVVIELAPQFAPHQVQNVEALARGQYFDGLDVVRSQDNYVVQWADPTGKRPVTAGAARTLAAEFERPLRGLAITKLPDVDTYAGETGFVDGFPVAADPALGRAWLVHCYGMVGAGRDNDVDSGGGTELYAVIGQGMRHLDRNVTLLGPPQRSHSNSASSNHHGITARDAGHRHCVRTGSLLIHDDAEIHLHPFDIDPLTREPDLGG